MTENNPMPGKFRQLLFSAIAIFIGLLFIFGVGELIFRLLPGLTNDPPAPPPHNYRMPHDLAGWVVKEGYQFDGEMKDFKGNPYPLHVNFGKFGFRKWGDPASSKPKILFIGDSYTASVQTSDDKVFYQLLADSLPVEVFAYGAAGFSSTQELMIADYYLQQIKPDLIIWQVCSNDFLDNYWELEKIAGYHVRMRRPYTLENGAVEYHTAAEWPRNVKKYSRFLYFILKQWKLSTGTFDQPPAEPAEKLIGEKGLAFEPFSKSCNMTAAVFQKVKNILPASTLLMTFDADGFQPQYDQFARIFREKSIPFIDGLDNFVRMPEASGACVRADDGYHWNNLGQQRVAAYLKPYIEKYLLEKK